MYAAALRSPATGRRGGWAAAARNTSLAGCGQRMRHFGNGYATYHACRRGQDRRPVRNRCIAMSKPARRSCPLLLSPSSLQRRCVICQRGKYAGGCRLWFFVAVPRERAAVCPSGMAVLETGESSGRERGNEPSAPALLEAWQSRHWWRTVRPVQCASQCSGSVKGTCAREIACRCTQRREYSSYAKQSRNRRCRTPRLCRGEDE